MAFTNSEVIDGVNILVKVAGNVIGLQTDGSLTIERETKDVKFKAADRSTSLWMDKTAGMMSWNVSQSAYWMPVESDASLTSFRDLFAVMTSADAYEVEVVIEYADGAITTGDDVLTYTGQAIITNLSHTITNVGEDSTFSCTLEGKGALVEAESVAP